MPNPQIVIDTNVLIAALLTSDYLTLRADRGSRARFEQALAGVPAAPPDPQDALE